jgi:glycosyltransferase involved in cell wall biosynthesis
MPFLAPSLGSVFKKLRKNGVKTVSILDNVIPHEKRIGDIALIKYFLRQNNGFIVMSEKVKNDLLSLHPDAKYLQVLHPLYDHFGNRVDSAEARSKLGIPQSNKVILFFGFIRDYKGLDLLIEAVKLLPNDYTLIIAGEVYGDFKRYQNIIDKNSLGKKVQLFTRYIPDNEVPLFFSASDVCVLPYRSGTQSGITGISYHFELPVIVTDAGGLKEMVEDGKTGLVVKEPSPQLIADAIRKYYDEGLKEKFRKEIQEYKTRHSWSALADDIISFYKTL